MEVNLPKDFPATGKWLQHIFQRYRRQQEKPRSSRSARASAPRALSRLSQASPSLHDLAAQEKQVQAAQQQAQAGQQGRMCHKRAASPTAALPTSPRFDAFRDLPAIHPGNAPALLAWANRAHAYLRGLPAAAGAASAAAGVSGGWPPSFSEQARLQLLVTLVHQHVANASADLFYQQRSLQLLQCGFGAAAAQEAGQAAFHRACALRAAADAQAVADLGDGAAFLAAMRETLALPAAAGLDASGLAAMLPGHYGAATAAAAQPLAPALAAAGRVVAPPSAARCGAPAAAAPKGAARGWTAPGAPGNWHFQASAPNGWHTHGGRQLRA